MTRSDFGATAFLDSKVALLDDYFQQFGIDAAVVGLSGGVDSAVVAGVLKRCALRRVVVVAAPAFSRGATNQPIALRRAERQAEAFGLELWKVDLTQTQLSYEAALAGTAPVGSGSAWADGQVLSIARTPVFYGAAARLQVLGYRSVVAGTTNRSEGSYIGFYGKASDGMCDVQPISDLWKSQVVALARHLSVPDEIVNEQPRGDVWDGLCDEQMIGASYSQLEAYLEDKCAGNERPAAPGAVAIEALHRVNRHKYLVGSPAVHFDVLPRYVPGGWSSSNSYTHVIGRKYV